MLSVLILGASVLYIMWRNVEDFGFIDGMALTILTLLVAWGFTEIIYRVMS